MTVGVLETLTGQSGATCRGTEHEPAGHLVCCSPETVAGALETEHRVEDVQRDHDLAVRRVRGTDRGERRRGACLVDALVQDLTDRALLVGEHQFRVDRGVQLAVAVVDLQRREPRVHTERAGLVGNDRHDSVADLLVSQQLLHDAHERHGGGDFLLARALAERLVGVVAGLRQWLDVDAALGDESAELAATIEHVLDLGSVRTGVVVRRHVRILLELLVGDRDVLEIAERLEIVERQLLHLVRGITALEVLAQGVALDGVRQDDRRLALVRHRSRVGGVHLAVVVTAALEVPDLVVREILDELLRSWVAAEEVIADVAAVVGLVGLKVAVGRGVHEVHQCAVAVLVQQRVPLAAPDDLDDVPAGTAEERLQFLDDLAVTAHRAVETLQVAVDDEREVVEAFGRSHVCESTRFRLVHLAVAEVRPDVLIGGVLDAAVVQVVVEARLVDGVHRTEAHRHRRELPKVLHQPWVRVRRQSAALVHVARFLAEAVHALGRDAAFEERAGVDAGGGVALNEDVVAAARVILAAEEVVEADLVQRSRRRVGRDVATDADARTLCAVHHDRGVPADPGSVAAFHRLVAGEPRLVLGGNRVDVVRRCQRRERDAALTGALEQPEHQVASAVGSGPLQQAVERLDPFVGLVVVDIGQVRRDTLTDDADPAVRALLACRRCVLPFAAVHFGQRVHSSMWRTLGVAPGPVARPCDGDLHSSFS
ncbi:unannotated protein [freshwater metagenome]|uniref:Unannotated protein n=1 Tax=freshwater metagenome TaxID=449393 RepID=A0A6J7HJ99_9ZZZZ